METKLAEQVGEVGAAQVDSSDRLWKHFATAIREAVSETYPPQARQTKSRLRETQDAVEAMLCSCALLVSYRPLVLGKGHFNVNGVHTPVYIKRFMIFCMYGGCRQTIDGHENRWIFVQKETLRRSRTTFCRISKGLGNKEICTKSGGCRAPSLANALSPNARRYDAAKKVNPSQHEWMAFLQNVNTVVRRFAASIRMLPLKEVRKVRIRARTRVAIKARIKGKVMIGKVDRSRLPPFRLVLG